MNISLSPFAPENLVVRDGFDGPVPRQPVHLHTLDESGAYLLDSSRVPRRPPFIYYERSELLIDGDGEKRYAKKRAPSPSSLEILPTSDSELRPRRSSGVRLAYTNPSGKRQRAPSTPRWGPFSLQRSFRRAIASSVHMCFKESKHSFFKNKK